jgi:hypothetical protein
MSDTVSWPWGGDIVPDSRGITHGEFKIRQAELRKAIGPHTQYLETRFPSCRRVISLDMARRMAEVRGVYVVIPWRCWRRIDNQSLLRQQKEGKEKARAGEDAGQLEL